MSAVTKTWVAVSRSDNRDSNLLLGREKQVDTQRPVKKPFMRGAEF